MLGNEGFDELSNLVLLMARKSADRVKNSADSTGWAGASPRFSFPADQLFDAAIQNPRKRGHLLRLEGR